MTAWAHLHFVGLSEDEPLQKHFVIKTLKLSKVLVLLIYLPVCLIVFVLHYVEVEE